jgi:hypothetical protein
MIAADLTNYDGAATPSAPNSQLWELTYEDGKGFILFDSGKEIVRDVD